MGGDTTAPEFTSNIASPFTTSEVVVKGLGEAASYSAKQVAYIADLVAKDRVTEYKTEVLPLQAEDLATSGRLSALGLKYASSRGKNYPMSILECTETTTDTDTITKVYFVANNGNIYNYTIPTTDTKIEISSISNITGLESFRKVTFTDKWDIEDYRSLYINLVPYKTTTSYEGATDFE